MRHSTVLATVRTAAKWAKAHRAAILSTLFKLGRVAVSVGLIIFLIHRLDVGKIADHFRGLSIAPLVVAVGLDLLMIATQAWRWSLLLRARGIGLRMTRLIYYYLVSIFFSAFLPTSVGGDVARIVAVSTATPKKADAVASIVVERIMGFFVLLPVSLIAMPFVAGQLKEWKLILAAEAVGVFVLLAFLVLLVRPVARTCSRILNPIFDLLSRFKLRGRLERVYASIVIYKDSRGAVYGALALSFLSRLLWVGACYSIARAFSLNLSFQALLVVAPIVELVRMIPVSISGVGVREAAFVAMLRQFGVEDSLGFSFGAVVYLVFFIFAIVGGILYGARSLGMSRHQAPSGPAS